VRLVVLLISFCHNFIPTGRIKVAHALALSPVGTFLTVGGFFNFMLTGSTSALRFGIVLGFALLALGISSLRSQRGGRRSRLLLKGQAG
jgi:hypothetical protein